MDNQKLIYLIKLAIEEPARKKLYLEVLPKMTAQEKIDVGLQLWQIWLMKLNTAVKAQMSGMIEEIADNENGVMYDRADFDKVEQKVVNELIRERTGLQEQDQLSHVREELAKIQEIVQTHEQEISQIKTKIGSQE